MGYKFVEDRISVDPVSGEMITPEEFQARGHSASNSFSGKINTEWESREQAIPTTIGLQCVSDLKPYKSIITGETIAGRKQHRDHLRAHNCIEVGNEPLKPQQPTYVGGVAQDIKQAMEQHGY